MLGTRVPKIQREKYLMMFYEGGIIKTRAKTLNKT
jgi:hypothetical protein